MIDNLFLSKKIPFKEQAQCFKKQKQRVHFLLLHEGNGLTPYQIHRMYCRYYPEIPKSSLCQVLMTLCNENKVIKTNIQIPERFGKPNHLWKAL